MGKRIPQVDAYIARAQPFSRPILKKIRGLFHRACPQVQETIKWGVPFFQHKGPLGMMAGFKRHVRWGLWKAKLVKAPRGVTTPSMRAGQITAVSDLPADAVIVNLIKQAVALNESGVKAKPRTKRPPPKVPSDLAAALKKNFEAAATFKSLSPSHQREYVDWITEAKQEATRQRRLEQAIRLLSQGKSRNWKYDKRK